jgi:hypothetical protein
MILKPEAYVSKMAREKVRLTAWDILLLEETAEREAAQKFIRATIEKMGMSQADVEAEVFGGGKNWNRLGVETIPRDKFELPSL